MRKYPVRHSILAILAIVLKKNYVRFMLLTLSYINAMLANTKNNTKNVINNSKKVKNSKKIYYIIKYIYIVIEFVKKKLDTKFVFSYFLLCKKS